MHTLHARTIKIGDPNLRQRKHLVQTLRRTCTASGRLQLQPATTASLAFELAGLPTELEHVVDGMVQNGRQRPARLCVPTHIARSTVRIIRGLAAVFH